MNDVDCPYCEKGIEICHDDGFACEDGEINTYECPHCGKNFILTTSISINHDAYEAPCLNGSPHNMQPIKGCPAEAFVGKTRCTGCGLEEVDREANSAAMAAYFDRISPNPNARKSEAKNERG